METERLLHAPDRAGRIWAVLLNCVLVLLICGLITALITVYTFSLCLIEGSSMTPTLTDRQYVLVEKHSVSPARGDIVVFAKSDDTEVQYIKRVAAVAGDTVEFRYTGEYVVTSVAAGLGGGMKQQREVALYVNGELVEEEGLLPMGDVYWQRGGQLFVKIGQSVVVPEGKVFVLGDNRNDSTDSRDVTVGFVDINEELRGRVDALLPAGSFAESVIKLIYGVPFA